MLRLIQETKCTHSGCNVMLMGFEEYYTDFGAGPFCETHYKEWQAIDDRLDDEYKEFDAAKKNN